MPYMYALYVRFVIKMKRADFRQVEEIKVVRERERERERERARERERVCVCMCVCVCVCARARARCRSVGIDSQHPFCPMFSRQANL